MKTVLVGSAVLILFGLLEVIVLIGDPFYRISKLLHQESQRRARLRREAARRTKEVFPIKKLRR